MDANEVKVKVIKVRIPKMVTCPSCGLEQPFRKKGEYWKTVKEIHSEHTLLMNVQVVNAKCLNLNCLRKSFTLPISGIERYARSTDRMRVEAVAGLIQDNSTLPRISKRLGRSYNTTGSKSSLDRWKHAEADKYDIKDIIAALEFSGILTLDEYKPTRSDNYALIAGDAIKQRILYMETIHGFFGRGAVGSFLEKLNDDFNIKPWGIIFDLYSTYPRQVRKVWPNIIMQYDYFHIIQWIHRYLKNALLQFRKELKEQEREDMRSQIWQHKWRLLKNMDKWTDREHRIVQDLIDIYQGTIVEKVLIFKEQLYDIFELSSTQEEAYAKRDSLYRETWWRDSYHLCKAMKFLMSSKFPYMITYLGNSGITRSGSLENLNSVWRQMESVRFGFNSDKGRLNHLKLYQVAKYLGGTLPKNRESLLNTDASVT